MKPIPQFKEWSCNCKICQKMCDRPCFGTVSDIKKLIEAGYSDRLCLDWNSAPSDPRTDISFLTPALKDFEGKLSPSFPQSEKGCTFFKEGKCFLHDLKLKPLQGKTAIHSFHKKKLDEESARSCDEVKEYIMQDWKSEEGQALVDAWCKEHNIESKERVLDPAEFMIQYILYKKSK